MLDRRRTDGIYHMRVDPSDKKCWMFTKNALYYQHCTSSGGGYMTRQLSFAIGTIDIKQTEGIISTHVCQHFYQLFLFENTSLPTTHKNVNKTSQQGILSKSIILWVYFPSCVRIQYKNKCIFEVLLHDFY